MRTWEEYYKGERKRGFRFEAKDIKIIVEGSEYSEHEFCDLDSFEENEEFCKEYSYKEIVQAFKDFIKLVEKDWAEVSLRIVNNDEVELGIIFDRYYFIADVIIPLKELCKDTEKLNAINEKVEEIRNILRS